MQITEFLRRYGPWAVVTGASDGIGQACAHELARRGLNLVLVARREDRLQTLGAQLTAQHGVQVRLVVTDLARPHGNVPLFNALEGLDVGLLVAAAGFGSAGDFLQQDLQDEVEMLHVNCRSVLEQVWHVGQRLNRRQRGGVVLFSSLLGFHGAPGSANYAATKAYMQSLAEGLKVEWRTKGVDVLASAPGPVHTGFAQRAHMRMAKAATPEVVARVTLDALGRQGTVRPGWLSKVLGWSLATAPRGLRVEIMGRIMQGMSAPGGRP